jgi:hypothetical protein
MKQWGYELEFSTVVKIIFTDTSLSPNDGFFYIKSLTLDDDKTTVISTFNQDNNTTPLDTDRSMILADFWEEGVEFSWYKEDEDSDQWVIEVSGLLILEPIHSFENADTQNIKNSYIEESDITSLQLEFRRDGDSPPESFDAFEFVNGEIFSVKNLVKNDDDEWEEATNIC